MRLDVKFAESNQAFNPDFGEVVNVSDGGFERGYEAGYKDGTESGFALEDSLIDKSLTEYHNPRPITVGNRSFSYCYNLVLVDIPNAVSVAEYAFVYCTALKEIVLPSATNISPFAFQNCTNLTKADIHVAERLNSNVFTNTNLTTLILRRTDKIIENGSTASLNNTPIAKGNGYIYVPAALADIYKNSANWKTYASQIRTIEDYPEICGD